MRFERMSRGRAWVLAASFLLLLPARGTGLFDIPAAVPPRVIAADYFGTHFHRLEHAADGYPATPWPDDLVGAVRLWDSHTRWADVEPKPGQFDFALLDALVDAARAHHAKVSLVLGSPPRWASARPDEPGPYGQGSAAEPADLARWDRYVDVVARRYQGRIDRYELWNEPYFSDFVADRGQPGAFFTGSAAVMVELARRARAVITRDDPHAQLLTPGFVGATNRLELYLNRGGGRYVDGVAYHFYAEDDAAFVRLYADVRAVMARHGMGGRPLVDTESGFALRGSEGQPIGDGEAPIDRHRAAVLLSRSMILGAWLGVDRFYQYAWDNGRMGMLLPDGRTATESLRAYVAVRRWLLGTTVEGCRSVDASAVRCDGVRNGERLLVAWQMDGGARVALPLPEASTLECADGCVVSRSAGTLVLPVDGTPVAVWMQAPGPVRHTAVMPAN